jgi:hypothetical protein
VLTHDIYYEPVAQNSSAKITRRAYLAMSGCHLSVSIGSAQTRAFISFVLRMFTQSARCSESCQFGDGIQMQSESTKSSPYTDCSR